MIRTCSTEVPTFVSHEVAIPPCCPVSANPAAGSVVTICYRPDGIVFPVEDLVDMINGYVGGRGEVRNMEEMIQDIASRVSTIVRVPVRAIANLNIIPPFGGEMQKMRVTARAKN